MRKTFYKYIFKAEKKIDNCYVDEVQAVKILNLVFIVRGESENVLFYAQEVHRGKRSRENCYMFQKNQFEQTFRNIYATSSLEKYFLFRKCTFIYIFRTKFFSFLYRRVLKV